MSINEDNSVIDLIVSDEYVKCLNGKTKQNYDWDKSCEGFIDNETKKSKEEPKDPNYCEVLEWLAEEAYNSFDYVNAAEFYDQIITSVNECETNPSYHKLYTVSLSKITARDLEGDLESWAEIGKLWSDAGKISESFNTYNRICGIIGVNCEKGELELKLTLLSSIANLMNESRGFGNSLFDKDLKILCEINQALFNQVSKYSKGVLHKEKQVYVNLIERNRMDCDE